MNINNKLKLELTNKLLKNYGKLVSMCLYFLDEVDTVLVGMLITNGIKYVRSKCTFTPISILESLIVTFYRINYFFVTYYKFNFIFYKNSIIGMWYSFKSSELY